MLECVDRVQLAVRDRSAAVDTFGAIIGAQKEREDFICLLNADRTVVRSGESEFELLQPAGDGPVADFLQRRGEGIYAAGFATSDLGALTRHMNDAGLHFREQGGQVFVESGQTRGMRMVIGPILQMGSPGLITHLYEVTNIVDDHKKAASYYAQAFGLDVSRFVPIKSERWGYEGTLTMFNPPARLDRIELTQIAEPSLAMGRFYARRGKSIYMCFGEADEPAEIRSRLQARGARYAADDDYQSSLFIHPSALHGMLMGVSRTNLAWRWSGRPELAVR